MSEDIVMHLSSNSNPSDPFLPSKIAKLEARMVGKSSSLPASQSSWQSPPPVKQETLEDFQASSLSSDSDDDNSGEYLIQRNIQKRQRCLEDEHALVQSEEALDAQKVITEATEGRMSSDEPNKRRQGRGRGRAASSRGRSKASDQTLSMSPSMAALSNGNLDVTLQKESRSREQPDINEKAMLLEEVSLLRVKLASLEEELCKSRQEAVDHDQRCCQLEKELKDIKEQDQHMKIKRLKVLSDLLIAVSKSERQEARMKIRQDSLRLGSVGVIRTGTIISETWEDGQALKDINAHLKSLLETKEAVERHRKSLKKRQSDKGDGNDAETSMPEDDFLIQDEICKSRLSSIKREEENLLRRGIVMN
ncbi:hypothetical protein HPP92_004176 [Vanilla planifolia]|uniref:Uncharacterized protein n=1 Tax=Vanilla planifolia TaxID=51239 RepID=A0A835S362_VANPL|nr:hypothetical protein HPP92_004176 [Vanilla planifolia]